MRAQSQDQVAFRGPASASVADVRIEEIAFDAPWSWLAAGWRDMWAVPQVSLDLWRGVRRLVDRLDARV